MQVILPTIVVLYVLGISIRIVRPYEKGIVERVGAYNRTVEAGIHIILPFIDRMTKIDTRENVVDVQPQMVITKDNANVKVDAVIYYKIVDSEKALYGVRNFLPAVEKLAQTNLRNIVGELTLDESLTSRDATNEKLRDILDDATDAWGAKVTRVELQEIDPPEAIKEAMHEQMISEREKRAAITRAEGSKKAVILESEGHKQSAILEAQGKANAIKEVADAEKYQKLTVAKGESEAIKTVYNSIHEGQPTKDLIAIKYLDILPKIADGKSNTLIVPVEFSGISSVVAGLLETVKATKEKSTEKKEAEN